MTGSRNAGLNASILVLCTALTACGGGGDAPSAPPNSNAPPEQQQPEPTPTQSNAVITTVPSVTARNVERYLDFNLGNVQLHHTFSAWENPPVVRVTAGTTDERKGAVIQAVAAVNTALPPEWHIRIGADTQIGLKTLGEIDHERFAPNGVLLIDMDIPVSQMPGIAGDAHSDTERLNRPHGLQWAQIRIREDQSPGEILHHTLVHEIIHALGFLAHFPAGEFHPNSVTSFGYGGAIPQRNIPRIDVAVVRTVYENLGGGQLHYSNLDAEDFGAWDSQIVRIADSNGGYGVDYGNGLAVPWTRMDGTTSYGAPSRSAIWRGQLVGMTPNGQPVDGDAALRVNVTSMSGTAMFTDIEHHGTDRPWHGGDLDYAISVTGATFHDASGELAGRFLGHNHARTVGTLDRADLAAAFGASR